MGISLANKKRAVTSPMRRHGEKTQVQARVMPPGGLKIAEAFELLLTGKDFSDITIDDIVRTSGVNAALIYKYYGDKRGLLYQLLSEGLDRYLSSLERELKGIKGALNKLRKIIWIHVSLVKENRVLGRILLLEARSHQSFFSSEGYKKIRQYNGIIRDIISEGVEEGDIRGDLPVLMLNQILVGAIEHLCMPWVISGEELSEDDVTEFICQALFRGIEADRTHKSS